MHTPFEFVVVSLSGFSIHSFFSRRKYLSDRSMYYKFKKQHNNFFKLEIKEFEWKCRDSTISLSFFFSHNTSPCGHRQLIAGCV